MFIDASAIVGIIANEPDQFELIKKLESSNRRWVSAITVFEAVLALMRINGRGHLDMLILVEDFQTVYAIKTLEIDTQIALGALDAFARFGKGSHAARLNMGDCFSYACAKNLKQPLLFKGNDFSKTDLPIWD